MMRKMLGALIAFVILVGAALFFLLGTQPGSRWLLAKALPRVSGLRIERIEGTLLSPLTLREIDYRSDGMHLSIHDASLRWEPSRLLFGEVSLERLSVEGVRYEQTETAPPKTTPPGEISLPSLNLPVAVVIKEATVSSITFVQPGSEPREINQISLAGRADRNGIAIQSLRVNAPAFEVALQGALRPKENPPIEAAVDWSAAPSGDLTLRGKGKVQGDLKNAQLLHELTEPFYLRTEGAIGYQKGSPTFDLHGGWEHLQWPPSGDASVESSKGSYHLVGGIDDYRLSLDTAVAGAQIPASDLGLEGTGNQNEFVLKRLDLATLNGTMHGSGRFGWTPAVQWQLSFSGADLNPGVKWTEWPGKIGFDIATEGRLVNGTSEGKVQLTRLAGRLRGYPLSARVQAAAREGAYSVDQLLVQSGSASLKAAGRMAERWDLRWSLKAPDLLALYPGARGRLVADGTVQGAKALPLIKAHAEGGAIDAAGVQLKALRLDLNIDMKNQSASHVALLLNDLAAAGQAVHQASLRGEGTVAKHQLQLDVDAGERGLIVRMDGGWREPVWQGKLTQSELRDPVAGRWGLAQPVSLTLSAQSVETERTCFTQERARLCATGKWEKAGAWETAGELKQISLDLLKPWLPAALSLKGEVDGSWSASGEGERLEGEAKLIPRPGTLLHQISKKESLTVPYQDGMILVSLKEQRLQADAALTLVGQGGFRAQLALSPALPDWHEGRLEGELHAHLDQLQLIALLTPMIEKPQGKVQVNLAFHGKPAEPKVKGEILLEEGATRLPKAGIDLRQAKIEIRSRDEGILSLHAEAFSGPGTIQIDGQLLLNPQEGWPIRLSIKGDRFESVDLPEAHLLTSPNLTIVSKGHRVDVEGEILIPEGAITLKELPKGAVQVSEDVVIVAAPKGTDVRSETASPWEIHSQVRIRLGEKVTFKGFGLTARLAGHLLATEAPNRPTLGEGELQILEGQYRSYGQKLDIDNGRLLFSGPIDNPGLDIRAVRKIPEATVITVGLHIEGTAKHPQTTVFSDPPMEQSEALAYLLLGHPLNQANKSEGSLLTNAVSALGLKGGDLVAKKVGRALGVDEVRIQTDEQTNSFQSATLVVGRYLSPKFYVSYGIGIFEEKNTLLVRYKINRILTLKAESGDVNGIDLLYTKEYN
ncbi:MAG: translocation/assembly module TamB domain-containing protein [Nitrospirae bacterium]|nr:translocation/assembly module TamB domain-containing protein [Candidatus Manganitrophaceae bacterium]